jgi:hypothetical protein
MARLSDEGESKAMDEEDYPLNSSITSAEYRFDPGSTHFNFLNKS